MWAWLADFLVRFSGRAQRQGKRLLVEHLTPMQREQLECYGYFEVVGGDTKRIYRVYDCSSMNVEVDLDEGYVRRLCFAPVGRLVRGDVLLAQKLALELFENQVLREANMHTRPSPDRRSGVVADVSLLSSER